ncbi:hypothetical protein DCC85_10035 [Paenibacillus sp. CAA11]|uniref:DUF5643 domain-containing protein n=1 Tax=Paenibacillus sp. CAA11 TaxID=1532905 RepID=UPI000D383971|nr:DUF5643 domain-containing protein [Paenibacillus sp. CAA11]AWB44531.1 hypothetical protein DCC85_10035 [Paenibacillus sp. CAA11]
MKTVYKVMSSVALAGMIVGGVAWSNVQAANQATSKTEVSQSAVKSAPEAARVTQNGITLEISNVIYDGNLLSMKLDRSGSGFEGGLNSGKLDEKTGYYVMNKGAISEIDVLINGKPIEQFSGKSISSRPSLGMAPGSNDNSCYIQLSDASQLGGNLAAFPDKFQATVSIHLEGIEKPYTMNIPVEKTTEKATVLQPNLTRTSGNFSMTLKKANLVSTSSRLQFVIKGWEQNRNILFDFVDDQGNKIERLGGRGTDENNSQGDYYFDYILGGLSKETKSITIKPFTPEFEKPNATSGAFKVDSNGDLIKHYVKELEMTLQVK